MFFVWAWFLLRFTTSKSDSSSSANLSTPCKGTELDLGGATGDESGVTLVLSLLVLNSFKRNSSGLLTFTFISNLFCSPSYPSNPCSLSNVCSLYIFSLSGYSLTQSLLISLHYLSYWFFFVFLNYIFSILLFLLFLIFSLWFTKWSLLFKSKEKIFHKQSIYMFI